MAYNFMKLLVQPEKTVGDSLSDMKRDTDLYGRCWYWHNMAGFNLYGDPEVSLFDSAPQSTPIPALSGHGKTLLVGALAAVGCLTVLRRTSATAPIET